MGERITVVIAREDRKTPQEMKSKLRSDSSRSDRRNDDYGEDDKRYRRKGRSHRSKSDSRERLRRSHSGGRRELKKKY